MVKVRGYKKAIGDYNRWLSMDCRNTARIMLNLETGEVFCEWHIDCNETTKYAFHCTDLTSYFIKSTKQYDKMTYKAIRDLALDVISRTYK